MGSPLPSSSSSACPMAAFRSSTRSASDAFGAVPVAEPSVEALSTLTSALIASSLPALTVSVKTASPLSS
jgi:hypothetical protein